MNSIFTAAKSYRFPNSQFFQLSWTKYSTTASAAVPDANIKIPNRIPRGPTDILKALEKTVSYDLSGPAYRFYDDPHVAPYHERQERMYSLAKSAGRKAARWFKEEHPELFTQVISDPPILSYMPSTPITEDTVSEKMLREKISGAKVTDAMKVYQIMSEKKMELSQDSRLALFELLCFYNSEDPLPIELEAERFYGQVTNDRRDRTVNNWKNETLVTDLFNSLESMGSAPYCALLCGLYKFGAKTEGDELLLKAKEKNIKFDVYSYNACILRIISKYETSEVKYQMVMDILKEMSAEGVKPNLDTLNACMDVLTRLGFKNRKEILLGLMADFYKIGIEPSIGTYSLLVRGSMSKSRPDPTIMKFVGPLLKSYQGKELAVRHIADVTFFEWIMRACVLFDDLDNAVLCLNLLLTAKNRIMLDGLRSMNFYNNFFRLLIAKSDFQTLLKYYKRLVPHAHTPGPQFYEMLFEACDLNTAVAEIPGFWSDYIATGALDNNAIMKMLEVSVNLISIPSEAAETVIPKLGKLASELWNFKFESEESRIYVRDPITPELCNLLITLLGKGCQWRSVQSCLQWLAKNSFEPEQTAIQSVLESCYDHNNPNVAVWALKFCRSNFTSELGLNSAAAQFMQSDFLTKQLKDELKEDFDESSSSSSSSESDPEGENSSSDDDSSDSEDISIPRKSKTDILKDKK